MSHFKEFSHSQLPTLSPYISVAMPEQWSWEDIVAVRILQELQQHSQLQLAALPLVGEGRAYTQLGIPQCKPCLRWLHLHGWAAAGARFGSGLLN